AGPTRSAMRGAAVAWAIAWVPARLRPIAVAIRVFFIKVLPSEPPTALRQPTAACMVPHLRAARDDGLGGGTSDDSDGDRIQRPGSGPRPALQSSGWRDRRPEIRLSQIGPETRVRHR